MIIPHNWLVLDEEVKQCKEYPHPNGCTRECVIESYVHEDIALVRDEVIE
jgi:hypothetical protein